MTKIKTYSLSNLYNKTDKHRQKPCLAGGSPPKCCKWISMYDLKFGATEMFSKRYVNDSEKKIPLSLPLKNIMYNSTVSKTVEKFTIWTCSN